jgi:hypothetical protein
LLWLSTTMKSESYSACETYDDKLLDNSDDTDEMYWCIELYESAR